MADAEFKLWDVDGNLIMDLDSQPSIIRGTVTIPANTQGTITGSDTHPSYANQRPFIGTTGGSFELGIIETRYEDKRAWLCMFDVVASISGQTLTWTVTNRYGGVAARDLQVVYGVY